MKKIVSLIILTGLTYGCKNSDKPNLKEETTSNYWRGEIHLSDTVDLPFTFSWREENGKPTMSLINGGESIDIESIEQIGDSLKIQMPVFTNYLMVKKEDNFMSGFYINPDAKDYRLPLDAARGDSTKYIAESENCCDINQKWAVKFSPESDDERTAIAYFDQNVNEVSGTFLTETGDYRYLSGVLSGNEINLSSFDGAHLHVFKAQIKDGDIIEGQYFSGRSHSEPWMAYRDDSFELRNPDSLTFLREGYEKLSFSLPDLSGNTVSLLDDQFKGKPVVIQITGSWCPNCMDETRYLKALHEKHHDQGLEIVALAFERYPEFEKAKVPVQKMIDDLGIPYEVLIGGSTRDSEAVLPMLNHIMSYPTAIYLDRNHDIVKIHTGFSGPGTPVYGEFVADNQNTIDKIIATN